MALIKILRIGDELVFDLGQIADGAKREISLSVVEKAGRQVVLKLTADRSIPIKHYRQQTVPAT